MESSIPIRKVVRNVQTQTSERHLGLGKCVEGLLPGIPDEITLEKICTKLPWRAFKILSLVSPTWQKAIESRQVYNARVRACTTETLVVHLHYHRLHDSRLALYSRRDDCCYEVPPIPHLDEGIPVSCGCVGLDGKIYVLGGEMRLGSDVGRSEVFVLDLAGGREWKQCASMQAPRLGFGCGVSGEKIYVFGGICDQLPVEGSEVYDPKVNAWSPIMPMPSLRCHHRIATIGEELFAYDGDYYDPGVFERDAAAHAIHGCLSDYRDIATFLEVYHPMKNEWREVETFKVNYNDAVFTVKGEFHTMDEGCIEVYDLDDDWWNPRHVNAFPEFDQDRVLEPRSGLAVENDLFVTVGYSKRSNKAKRSVSLFQSRGFDIGKEEIVWQKTSCPRQAEPLSTKDFDVLCPIKL